MNLHHPDHRCIETGEYLGELDWTGKIEAYRDWMRRHRESREAWEIGRLGAPRARD